MTYATGTPNDFVAFDRDRLQSASPQTIAGAVALAVVILAGAWTLDAREATGPSVNQAPVAASIPGVAEPPATAATTPVARPRPAPLPAPVVAIDYDPLFDPAFSLGPAPVSLALSAPLAPDFEFQAPPPPVTPAEPDAALPVPLPAVPEFVQNIPLPEPRPPELQSPAGRAPFRAFGRQVAQQSRATAPQATPPDNRNFLEKLFGMPQPPGPVLAYAAPEDGVLNGGRNIIASPVGPYDRWTAVYDIAAHTVYLPDGTRLEAHSGLGDRLDDPRHVNERNRGATPPNVYELAPREQLFHGVQALRLNPVGGGGVFGRTGLLAHTYMLGPNGDSNGCVSFRNYSAFLRAFSDGQIKRLAVVTHL